MAKRVLPDNFQLSSGGFGVEKKIHQTLTRGRRSKAEERSLRNKDKKKGKPKEENDPSRNSS